PPERAPPAIHDSILAAARTEATASRSHTRAASSRSTSVTTVGAAPRVRQRPMGRFCTMGGPASPPGPQVSADRDDRTAALGGLHLLGDAQRLLDQGLDDLRLR